ncbi:helix-turn-helix domain-containing protein [Pseudomonas aeruginosa]|uniref:helix-turn-helix domain-containing protein n=1 Tax=Pseudomonas aeruginosa TaxID=287 RepID=UPI000EAE0A72|nr:helix-turn-helix domain-containing protein [Pseudomonas aeruginosa]
MNQAATVSPLAVGPEEAGRISGHTRSAIYEAIARGDLLSFKSGKRRLILIKELEAWLNRMAKENAR